MFHTFDIVLHNFTSDLFDICGRCLSTSQVEKKGGATPKDGKAPLANLGSPLVAADLFKVAVIEVFWCIFYCDSLTFCLCSVASFSNNLWTPKICFQHVHLFTCPFHISPIKSERSLHRSEPRRSHEAALSPYFKPCLFVCFVLTSFGIQGVGSF